VSRFMRLPWVSGIVALTLLVAYAAARDRT
jgi:hypothetical protein